MSRIHVCFPISPLHTHVASCVTFQVSIIMRSEHLIPIPDFDPRINSDCRFQFCLRIFDVALILFNSAVGQLLFQHFLDFCFVDWLLLCVRARRLWSRRNAGQPIEYPSSLVLIVLDLSCGNWNHLSNRRKTM